MAFSAMSVPAGVRRAGEGVGPHSVWIIVIVFTGHRLTDLSEPGLLTLADMSDDPVRDLLLNMAREAFPLAERRVRL